MDDLWLLFFLLFFCSCGSEPDRRLFFGYSNTSGVEFSSNIFLSSSQIFKTLLANRNKRSRDKLSTRRHEYCMKTVGMAPAS